MAKIKITGSVNQNEGGKLSSLWRSILRENNLMKSLDVLANEYVNNTLRMGESKNVERKTRGTLANNITSKSMTIKTFFDLLFNYLGVRKVVLSVSLTHQDGEVTHHSVNVVNPKYEKIKDKNDTEDKWVNNR